MVERPSRAGGGRRRRRFGLAALGCGLGLLAFELVLQAVAFGVWSFGQRQDAVDGSTRVALCVGDSFTYGLGAGSEDAYPAQARRLLAARGQQPWTLLNRGWPGQTSRDVLTKLSRQLADAKPDVVFVLVGANDLWARPDLLAAAELAGLEDASGFPLRWRTLRLLELALDRWRSEARDANPEFLGSWFEGPWELVLAPNGSGRINEMSFDWRIVHGTLMVRIAGDGREMPMTLQRVGETLRVAVAALEEKLLLRRARDDDEILLLRSWAALRRDQLDAAVAGFTALLARGGRELEAHEGLAVALIRASRVAAAEQHVAWLRQRCAREPGSDCRLALARCLAERGSVVDALVIAVADLRRGVRDDRLLPVLAQCAETHGAVVAPEVIERARVLPEGDAWRVALVKLWVEIVAADRPAEAVRQALAIADEVADIEEFVAWLRAARVGLDPEMVRRACAELEARGTMSGQTRDLARRVGEVERYREQVLEPHLELIVDLCRRAGGEPVLLNYPAGAFATKDAQLALQHVAERRGVRMLNVAARFSELLRDVERSELFVADDHCTGRGYAEIGRLVAEEIVRWTEARRGEQAGK